jgi:hypothetical protein
MKNLVGKVVIPASLVAASFGLSMGSTTLPASATTVVHETSASAPVTLTGTILKLDRSKYLFWFSVGERHLRVRYYSTTTFSGGSNAMLAKGLDVSVVGTYAGTSTTLLKAASINA